MTKRRKPKFRSHGSNVQNVRNESAVGHQVNGTTFGTVNIDARSSKADDSETHSEPITMKATPSFKRAVNRAAKDQGMARSEFIRMATEIAVRYSDTAIDLDLDVDQLIAHSVSLYLQLRKRKSDLQEVMLREMSKYMTDDLLKEE